MGFFFLWQLSFEYFGSMDIEVTGAENLQCDISTWSHLSSPKWVFCKINKIPKFRENIPSIFFYWLWPCSSSFLPLTYSLFPTCIMVSWSLPKKLVYKSTTWEKSNIWVKDRSLISCCAGEVALLLLNHCHVVQTYCEYLETEESNYCSTLKPQNFMRILDVRCYWFY